ncbi:outer membrane beta-barrel protein [Providencia sp. PROV271]|uniref:outer membrane beta-barrel protein n=1 Tax=Providencia sp. PROV271 TaxID=2949959 RepID=UPI00234BD995|nr:outer membrane beta-barrel protein [Providencia sp. PROV271]
MMKMRVLSGVIFPLISLGAMAETISSGFYLSGKLGSSQFRNSQNTASERGTTVGALNWDMGRTQLENTSSSVFSPSIAVGYRFADDWQQPVRTELAFQTFGKSEKDFSFKPSASGYWNGNVNNNFALPATANVYQKTNVNTLMVNAFYDFPLGNDITPYVMASVGAAFVHHNISTSSNVGGQALEEDSYNSKKTNLAWAVGAGVAWDATENVSVELGYTFTDAGDMNTHWSAENGIIKGDGNVHTKVQLHSLHAGVRYHF